MIYRIAYVPGVWDLLHRGHLNLLRQVRAQCHTLVVGVVGDEGAAAYKRRPVHDQETRVEVMRELRLVDHVMLQETTDPSPNVIRLRPNALFHGDDWHQLREGQDTLEVLGIAYVMVPYTHGVSTSEILASLREREEVA